MRLRGENSSVLAKPTGGAALLKSIHPAHRVIGDRCEWHGIKPDFVKRAGMVAPRRPPLWHRFIIRPHPLPKLLFIRRGRRDASTFILDRAAPFFRTAWKAIPADSGLIPCHSTLTPFKVFQIHKPRNAYGSSVAPPVTCLFSHKSMMSWNWRSNPFASPVTCPCALPSAPAMSSACWNANLAFANL